MPASSKAQKQVLSRMLAGLACVVLALSCSKAPLPAEKEQEGGIHKIYNRGPVTVELDIDNSEPSLADRINLTLTIVADEDYDAELPRFGDRREQFGIVDYRTSQPELTSEGRRKVNVLILVWSCSNAPFDRAADSADRSDLRGHDAGV